MPTRYVEPEAAPLPATGGVAPDLGADYGDQPCDRGVAAMRAAFRETGGLARAHELQGLLEVRDPRDFVRLAELIVSGAIASFEWRDAVWIPMFQIERGDQPHRPGARRVVAVLGAAFDGWVLSAWFASPNSWLEDRLPVDLIHTDQDAVLRAARADLFLCTGSAGPRLAYAA